LTFVETVPTETSSPSAPAEPKITTWFYYDNNGAKQGPVTDGQLKGLAKAGKITSGTAVENESGKTVPASRVKGLTFGKAMQPQTSLPAELNPFAAVSPVVVPAPTSVSFTTEEQADIDKYLAQHKRVGMPRLHKAALVGNVEIARFLITNGADVNAHDEYWSSPLHTAALAGNIAVAQFLISEGANVNLIGIDGQTPLDWAIVSGHTTMVQYLSSMGATSTNSSNPPLASGARSKILDVCITVFTPLVIFGIVYYGIGFIVNLGALRYEYPSSVVGMYWSSNIYSTDNFELRKGGELIVSEKSHFTNGRWHMKKGQLFINNRQVPYNSYKGSFVYHGITYAKN